MARIGLRLPTEEKELLLSLAREEKYNPVQFDTPDNYGRNQAQKGGRL